jgi:two-component system response regulator PilR (NtrC family)
MALAEDGVLSLDAPATAHEKPSVTAPIPLTSSDFSDNSPLPEDLQSHLDQQERDILIRTLKETGFNRTVAAQRLGLNLRQIRYRIARLKIEAPHTQDDESDAA